MSRVLIAGAGPTGLVTALSLAKSGVDVRIIDLLEKPTSQSRAAVIHARTLEMFERMGIVDDFLKVGVRVHGAAIYGPGNKLLTRPTLDHLHTRYPFMLGLDQASTEKILTEKLRELGVVVDRPVELIGFEKLDGQVAARMISPGGREQQEVCSYLVGADGARGATRNALGLHLEGETLDTTWITADVKIRWDRDSDEAIAYLTPDGIAFLAPMNDDRWRVIVNLHRMTKEEAENVSLEDVQSIVSERFGIDAPLYDPVWISPFSINTRMTPTMRVGHVFLAGDAAHVHSPVGGQGMNTGIQDALNLAWKLAAVLKGAASDSLLESYNAERHANAKRLLRAVGPATRMINLRQPVAVEIRNAVMHTVSHLGLGSIVARNFSMLEVAYPESPAVEDHRFGWIDHGPRAGERAPDVEGVLFGDDTPRRLFDLWKGDSRHQLLLFAAADATHENFADVAKTAAEFGSKSEFLRVIPIFKDGSGPDCVSDPDMQAHETYGAREPCVYLVRPDGYIGFRAPMRELDALLQYLAKWFPGV